MSSGGKRPDPPERKRNIARIDILRADDLDLPDVQVPPAEVVQAARNTSGVRRRSRPEIEGAPLVVVVDDDPAMRSALARMVGRRYRVMEAPEATTAMALCIRYRPALVISDLDMPGASGVKLAKLLLEVMGEEAPKLVIATGGDPERATRSGIEHVLTKPVSLEALHGLLEKLLEAESSATGTVP
jgi:CheY-like chemotaxis protein